MVPFQGKQHGFPKKQKVGNGALLQSGTILQPLFVGKWCLRSTNSMNSAPFVQRALFSTFLSHIKNDEK